MFDLEKQTYRFHVRAILFEGIFGGLMRSTGEIARKALGVDTLLLTLIVMAPAVSMGSVLFFGGWISRTGPRRLLRRAATLGRLPLALVGLLLVPGIGEWARTEQGQQLVPWFFLVLVTISSLATVPITSAWNGVLRSNYTDEQRGSLFGLAQRWGSLSSGVCTLGAGIWLHYQNEAFPWIYLVAALSGWLACHIFAQVPLRDRDVATGDTPKINSAQALWRILAKDRKFLRYEIGFVLYGIGFMALITAKPIWSVDAQFLHLSWPVLLGSKGVISFVMILLTPYFGRTLDRIGPGWLSAGCFLGLALYALLLSLATSPSCPISICVIRPILGCTINIASCGALVCSFVPKRGRNAIISTACDAARSTRPIVSPTRPNWVICWIHRRNVSTITTITRIVPASSITRPVSPYRPVDRAMIVGTAKRKLPRNVASAF